MGGFITGFEAGMWHSRNTGSEKEWRLCGYPACTRRLPPYENRWGCLKTERLEGLEVGSPTRSDRQRQIVHLLRADEVIE
jgi:hypothetical protein